MFFVQKLLALGGEGDFVHFIYKALAKAPASKG